jgi:Beta-glucan synthesis-associated protein SKN1/KRE6/Sbg1
MNVPEPDDVLHNPDPKRDRHYDNGGHIFTSRGIANLGCLFVLLAGMMMLLFVFLPLLPQKHVTNDSAPISAGYPIYSHFTTKHQSTLGAFNYGGTNSTGQVPKIANNVALIDIATPKSAYTKASYEDPSQQWDLVFSDEFNIDGRTFYPGDDPYWEAVDLYYWATVSMLLTIPYSMVDIHHRATWSGTIPRWPQQKTDILGSPSTLRIQPPITTCPMFQAWCVLIPYSSRQLLTLLADTIMVSSRKLVYSTIH